MKRPVYDVSMKLNVVEEYKRGGITYDGLSTKYNIPRATIASWILKLKNYHHSLITTEGGDSSFLNVTEQVNVKLQESSKEAQNEITLSINGFNIKGDLMTITRLITGVR